MYFYKYQSINILSLMMLKRGEVYFSSPEELNDRHECRPRYFFNGSKEVWLRFIDYTLFKTCIINNLHLDTELSARLLSLTPNIYRNIFKHTKKSNIEYTEALALISASLNNSFDKSFSNAEKQYVSNCLMDYMQSKLQQELHEPKYITSFSMSATNPTMWGHYGDADCGFLIIYQANENNVEMRSTLRNMHGCRQEEGVTTVGHFHNENLDLKEVKYAKVPAKVNGFSRLIHKFRYTEMESHRDIPELLYGDIKVMEEDNIGLVKFTDWKYEKEVRLFFPTFKYLARELRCLQVASHHIKGIVFGSHISNSDKERIIMACYHLQETTEMEHEFNLFQSIESHKKYEMSLKPIGLLQEHHAPKLLPLTPFKELSQAQQDRMKAMAHSIEASS